MFTIGVDYHPSVQQIAFTDTETGEFGERRLNHSDEEAEKFYRGLKQRGISVRVGREATCYSRWFERFEYTFAPPAGATIDDIAGFTAKRDQVPSHPSPF